MAIHRTISKSKFYNAVVKNLQTLGYQAYVDGLRDGAGNQTIAPDKDEDREARRYVQSQIIYVKNLRDFVFSDPIPDLLQILTRVGMWSNKSLDTAYNLGKLSGAKNKMLQWKLGATEKHCISCGTANGQVHRAKTWKEHGILPKSQGLECKGFRCDCKLEETTEQAKGDIKLIPFTKGVKHLHSHEKQVIKLSIKWEYVFAPSSLSCLT